MSDGALAGGCRAVLFDLDDTLVHTREVKWAHHRHVAREHYGIELDDDTLAQHWGKPFDEMIGLYYRQAASVEAMRAANQASAHLFPKTPVEGAVEVVTALLDEGVLVGVLTSTNTDMTTADLARCGFPVERLVLVQGADQTPHHKPDAAVFDPALAVLRGRGVADVTYVGDAVIDARAAEGAGLGFVAVTTGLFDAAAFDGHRVVDDIRLLPTVL